MYNYDAPKMTNNELDEILNRICKGANMTIDNYYKDCYCYLNKMEEKPGVINQDQLTPRRFWKNIHDGKIFTTVEWMDGTKTTVSCYAEQAGPTEYTGFTAAVAKKLYGSTSEATKLLYAAEKKTFEPTKQKILARQEAKRQKQERHRMLMEEREEAIRHKMEMIRIEEEARKRLEAEENGK